MVDYPSNAPVGSQGASTFTTRITPTPDYAAGLTVTGAGGGNTAMPVPSAPSASSPVSPGTTAATPTPAPTPAPAAALAAGAPAAAAAPGQLATTEDRATRSGVVNWADNPYGLDETDRQALLGFSERFRADPGDVLTAMIYEGAGSLNPDRTGPADTRTRYGARPGDHFRGPIQMGGPEQRQYGYQPGMTFAEYLNGPATNYFTDRLRRTGMPETMTLPHIYSVINGGSLHADQSPRWEANDHNGRAGYFLADHIERMQTGARYGPAVRPLVGEPGGPIPPESIPGREMPVPGTARPTRATVLGTRPGNTAAGADFRTTPTGEELRSRAFDPARNVPTPRQRPDMSGVRPSTVREAGPFPPLAPVGAITQLRRFDEETQPGPTGGGLTPSELAATDAMGQARAEGPGVVGGPGAPAAEPAPADAAGPPRPGSTIILQPGDNLWTIAATVTGDRNAASKYATEIMRTNGIRDPRALQPGQRIVLPGGMAAANIPTPRQRPGVPELPPASDGGYRFANPPERTGGPGQPGWNPNPYATLQGAEEDRAGRAGYAPPPSPADLVPTARVDTGPSVNAIGFPGQLVGPGETSGSASRSVAAGAHNIFDRQAADYARGLLDEGIGIGGEPPFNATSSRGIGARNASDMLWGDTEAGYLASGATGIEGEPDYHPQVPPASDLARQPAAAMRLPNSGAAFAREREWDPIVASMAARNRRLQLEALLRGNPDYAEGLRAY